MSEEKIQPKEELVKLQAKNKELKKKIKNAKGETAGKIQKSANESIEKNNSRIKELQNILSSVEDEDVSEEDVLEMIDNAMTLDELISIDAKLPDDAPSIIKKALMKRKRDIESILSKNVVASNKLLPWEKLTPKEIVEAQTPEGLEKDGKFYQLASFDPDTNMGQLKEKKEFVPDKKS